MVNCFDLKSVNYFKCFGKWLIVKIEEEKKGF